MTEKPKVPSLVEQLRHFTGRASAPEPQAEEPGYFVAPSRRSKKAVTIWVDPAVADQSERDCLHASEAPAGAIPGGAQHPVREIWAARDCLRMADEVTSPLSIGGSANW
jgi:hypothetical protein